MKCDKCGNPVNAGDQVCMNCGARLSTSNAIYKELEHLEKKETKKNKSILFLILGIVFILAIILYCILKG